MLGSLFMVACRNLARSLPRTLLTLLGAAAAVALLVTVQSITEAIGSQLRDVVESYGPQVIVYRARASSPLSSRVSEDELLRVQALVGRDAIVTPLLLGSLRADWLPRVTVIGTTADRAQQFRLVDGKMFESGERHMLLGQLLAERLGVGPGVALSLGGERFTITGLFSTGTPVFDRGVILDLARASELLERPKEVSVALIRARDRAVAKSLSKKISQALPRLAAEPADEFVGNVRVFQSTDAATRALSLIAFLIATMVVTNTLVMAINERRREIGILMTIGWPLRMLLTMLAIEGLILCSFGVLCGLGFSAAFLEYLNQSRAAGFSWLPVTLSPRVMAESVLLIFGLGAASLLAPALLIWRTTPIAALRHES